MQRWRRLGIIAGAGALPLRLAQAAGAPHVLRLSGLADADFTGFDTSECGIAEAGKMMRRLKEAGCDAIAFAGVVRRPDFTKLAPDWRGAALLPGVVAAAARGDGALLQFIVDTFEREGFRVIGAEEVASSLTAPAGVLTAAAPSADDWADIRKAAAIIGALGPFDVGQGAVVAAGLALAVEAAEGTDRMLERCAGLRGAARGGVLVKRPKPGQELRIDLPTIGVETVRRADAARLSGVAFEAGAALLIDREAVVEEANRRGLFLVGFAAAELAAP
jgi:hypothetical protein